MHSSVWHVCALGLVRRHTHRRNRLNRPSNGMHRSCEADASRGRNNRSSRALTKETLENLEDFLSVHALADFPEYILERRIQEEEE